MADVFHKDDWLTIWSGDCRKAMAAMDEQSVHTVITSPPYLGLRDYGVEPQVWGGDPEHEHAWGDEIGTVKSSPQKGLAFTGNGAPETRLPGLTDSQPEGASQGTLCECGAWRGALGLEPSPEMYIEHLVEVFRGVRRVLRDDGIAWLNLGDSYARAQDTNVPQTKNQAVPYPEVSHINVSAKVGSSDGGVGRADRPGTRTKVAWLKPKDLVGIPWMAAFALRADGWYLRQDIVWQKENAMPESVEDRPTRSHEFIFMLTKKPNYFYDHVAVKEPASETTIATVKAKMARAPIEDREYQHDSETRMGKRSPNRVWSDVDAMERLLEGRNLRDVWSVPTRPYKGAHYAVFPPALVEPMVKASTSERGCCPVCAKPWVRESRRIDTGYDGSKYGERAVDATGGAISGGTAKSTLGSSNGAMTGKTETIGWRSDCECGAGGPLEPVPCVVMDPFGGSGTVAMVAQGLGRRAVLVDLNPNYLQQQLVRNVLVPLGL